MSFFQRLSRYLIGIAIGCLAVYLIFPNHDWLGWTPGKQVMRSFRESTVTLSDSAKCEIECLQLPENIVDELRFNGAVDFKGSSTHEVPKRYRILYKEYVLSYTLTTDSTTLIKSVGRLGETTANCTCP